MGKSQVWLAAILLGLPVAEANSKAEVSSLTPCQLREFYALGEKEQELLQHCLELTEKKLAYQYGSDNPAKGGMDCSGTVSHILKRLGYPAPRMSHTIYTWAEKEGTLTRVEKCHSLNDPQLKGLLPGDLLFWEGTYSVGERNPPISHVMIFLGHEKTNGRAVMVGASSGRHYAGRARHGVSVFDFVMPSAKSTSKFVGYARVPGLLREDAAEVGDEPLPGNIPAVPRPAESEPARVVATVAGASFTPVSRTSIGGGTVEVEPLPEDTPAVQPPEENGPVAVLATASKAPGFGAGEASTAGSRSAPGAGAAKAAATVKATVRGALRRVLP